MGVATINLNQYGSGIFFLSFVWSAPHKGGCLFVKETALVPTKDKLKVLLYTCTYSIENHL